MIGYVSKRLELQAEIIVNLNIVSVLVEKSKIFGSDIVSMVPLPLCRWNAAASSRSRPLCAG